MTGRRFSVFEIVGLDAGQRPAEERIVFVCYLDDSDTELGRNMCLAGYYAKLDAWLRFERDVEPIFSEFGVDVLRGKDLVDGRGCFKGWLHSKKVQFTERVFSTLSGYAIEGVSSCVEKKWFKNEKEAGRLEFQNLSALGLAFSATLSSIILKNPTADEPMEDGLSFFVESGHRNNANLDKVFARLRKPTGFLPENSSLALIDKRSCRAIQTADMLAFFSRKEMNRINPRQRPRRTLFDDPIFKAMASTIQYRFNHLWNKPDNFKNSWDEVSDMELELAAPIILPSRF